MFLEVQLRVCNLLLKHPDHLLSTIRLPLISAGTVQPLSRTGQEFCYKQFSKGSTGKIDGKVFSPRNVTISLVSSCEALKTLIKDQLSRDIGAIGDLDVGFLGKEPTLSG